MNFLLHFRNLHQILNIFQKKFKPQSVCISEIIDFEKRGYLNA